MAPAVQQISTEREGLKKSIRRWWGNMMPGGNKKVSLLYPFEISHMILTWLVIRFSYDPAK